MKKLFALISILSVAYGLKAQTTNSDITEHNNEVKAKDIAIKKDIIEPAVQNANGEAPNWAALTKVITEKYEETTADRTITKAKIYFYYSKDWSAFCAGIVNYTNKYELANDYKLLNLNAGMILKISNEQMLLKEALRWAKAAADNEPGNIKYKETYDSLMAKITP